MVAYSCALINNLMKELREKEREWQPSWQCFILSQLEEVGRFSDSISRWVVLGSPGHAQTYTLSPKYDQPMKLYNIKARV